MPHFQVRLASADDRLPLRNMLELYFHDLSDYWNYELDRHGEYGYRLDKYWLDAKCKPFVFLVDGHYAGFALVDNSVSLAENEWWMAQFFVVRRHRRKGLAAFAARSIFDQIRGKWEVGQIMNNQPAQIFWRKIIADYTQGRYVEYDLNDERWVGWLQCFDNTVS